MYLLPALGVYNCPLACRNDAQTLKLNRTIEKLSISFVVACKNVDCFNQLIRLELTDG